MASSTSANPTGKAIAPSSSTAGFFQALPVLEPQFTLPSKVSSTTTTTTTTTTTAAAQTLSDDPVLARILALYLPPSAQESVGASLHDLSRLVLTPQVLQHAVDAETNPPTLQPLNTFGQVNAVDPLRTSEGWRGLKRIGVRQGVVSRVYAPQNARAHNRRIDQFAVGHAWSHTSTMTGCPMTMTDGAATLVAKSLREMEEGGQSAPAEESEEERRVKRDVFMEAYRRLTSDRPSESWTSGQWMTERSGGSDVRGTETVARRLTGEELQAEKQGRGRPQLDASGRPLGPWRIDGFKWFSSATDSDMTMLLAQTGKGLSAFMVPMRRQSSTGRGETELNGIRIQRLKNKMGTKAVPTAELELVGSRGWLVGEEGKGVKQISVILNITRLHTAMGSISYWSRGLAVCRAYSKIRRIRGSTLLTDNSQHVAWMAGETVKYWACTQLTFFGAALMGCVEQGRQVMNVTPAGASSGLIPQDPSHIADLLRLLTPVIKAQVSMAAVSGLRSCMECLGGVGYCENHEDGGILNIAKLFRDSVVNTIWEGTGSVMADDVGRVLRDKRIAGGRIIEDVFARWVRTCLSAQDSGDREAFKLETLVVDERLEVLLGLVAAVKKDPGELEYRGRDLLEHLEVLTSAVVLLWDAQTDKDEVAGHIATQYVWSRVVVAQSCYARPSSDWKTSAAIDRMIFLGSGYSSPSKSAREKL